MHDLGDHFRVDISKSKTPNTCVFRGRKYRISILSDSLIRFEYNEDGKFNDYPTLFASNRSFSEPKLHVVEDNEIIEIFENEIKLTILKYGEKINLNSYFGLDENLGFEITF